jgi:hypothetical protein
LGTSFGDWSSGPTRMAIGARSASSSIPSRMLRTIGTEANASSHMASSPSQHPKRGRGTRSNEGHPGDRPERASRRVDGGPNARERGRCRDRWPSARVPLRVGPPRSVSNIRRPAEPGPKRRCPSRREQACADGAGPCPSSHPLDDPAEASFRRARRSSWSSLAPYS